MPAAGEARNGRLCKTYLDVDGSIASPTWVELSLVQGGGFSGDRDLAEVKERAIAVTTVLLGHRNEEFTLQLTRRPNNANFDLIRDAYEAGTKVGLAMMSGTITNVGEYGWQGEVYVTGWEDDQSHDGTVVNVTFRPAADYTTAPDIVEISS